MVFRVSGMVGFVFLIVSGLVKFLVFCVGFFCFSFFFL